MDNRDWADDGIGLHTTEYITQEKNGASQVIMNRRSVGCVVGVRVRFVKVLNNEIAVF